MSPTSWGSTETALEEIAESAPVRAFLARVGALYPEYHVRTMPADALEPDGIPGAMSAARDGGESRVAVAVANAAVHGDDFKWHLDMDPADLDPTSPFAERYGVYVNRAEGASAVRLRAGVPQRTRAVDPGSRRGDALPRPGTATGVFVRPAPGRVLLMDQDVLHRVSAPSRSACVPRYSLVLKLCFYPKDPEARPSILRPEWGEPIAFGTAGRRAPSAATGDAGGNARGGGTGPRREKRRRGGVSVDRARLGESVRGLFVARGGVVAIEEGERLEADVAVTRRSTTLNYYGRS